MARKPHVGYEKKLRPKATLGRRERGYLSAIIIPNGKSYKMSPAERIIKLIIYVALRIVIRPKAWKDPKKNYEIIDRTYMRLISPDFIYIPAAIAFYLVMAFMPIMSLIVAIDHIDFIRTFITTPDGKTTYIATILGRFIPGMGALLEQISNVTRGSAAAAGVAKEIGAWAAIIFSLLVSTWIASSGFSTLVYTESYIYGHKYVGGYWMNKFKGFMMVLAFTLYLLIALFINIGFEHLLTKVSWSDIQKEVFRYFILGSGLFLLIFIGFVILYRFSPRFKTRIKWVVPGAMTSTIPTALFLIFFGTISSIWSYGQYGTVGVIMYIAIGALIVTYFIFVGILVNSSYHNTHVGKVEKKWTLSKK